MRRSAGYPTSDSVQHMEFLLVGALVILLLGLISVTGSLRVIRDASERTAAATEALLELERAKLSAE